MSRAPRCFSEQVTFIGVTDLRKSAAFYGENLGLSLALDQGTCMIFRSSGTAYIGLCTGLKPRPSDELILTLVTRDVDEWYNTLRTQVDVDGPPRYNPEYDITHFFLRDPDGYRLEIQCFHDPKWLSAEPRPSSGC